MTHTNNKCCASCAFAGRDGVMCDNRYCPCHTPKDIADYIPSGAKPEYVHAANNTCCKKCFGGFPNLIASGCTCLCHTTNTEEWRLNWKGLAQKKLEKMEFSAKNQAQIIIALEGPIEHTIKAEREEAYRQGQANPPVGFLRQFLNEYKYWRGEPWTNEQILEFIRIGVKPESNG